MARNQDRRRQLADAGLTVLAEQGARGLTHRAVDRHAGVPAGTASNYFRDRGALIEGLVERIGERLTPDPAVLERLGTAEPSRALLADYLRYVIERVMRDRAIAVSLFELRLEATRRPEVAAVLARWRRDGFAADIAFHRHAGLPGTVTELSLFHYAIDGLVLDRLTDPLDPETTTDRVVDLLVERLLVTPRSTEG